MSAFMLLNPANARIAVEAKLRGIPMSTYEADYRRRFGFDDVTQPLPPEHQAAMQRGAEQEAKRNKTEVLAGGLALGGTLAAGLSGVGAGTAAGGTAAGETGLASLVGPATGTIEAAPVIGAGGAPTISAVASGAGPFVPTVLGQSAAKGLSSLLDGGASSGGTAGGAAGSSTLERLISAGLPAALGYIGADKQADAMSDLSERYMAMGEPYRRSLAEISADPSKFYDSPTATKATDAVLRRLSVAGNPAHNPFSQALTIDALYDEYGRERDRLAGFGGLTQYNAAAPSAATAAIGADANKYNAIGAGAADFFYPPKRVSLSDILRTGL